MYKIWRKLFNSFTYKNNEEKNTFAEIFLISCKYRKKNIKKK